MFRPASGASSAAHHGKDVAYKSKEQHTKNEKTSKKPVVGFLIMRHILPVCYLYQRIGN